MLLMIFVNDAAGLQQIPNWIGHTAANVDGMGFSDVIFPAFLFIVGLSLPFALQVRMSKKTVFSTLIYIVLRSFALIAMGFFHVNLENYNHDLSVVPYPIFTILLTISFFLIWLDYPDSLSRMMKISLVGVGVATLLGLGFLFKGGTAEKLEGLQPHWWGILGIIGWAYLFSAITYLLTKGKLFWLVAFFLIFAIINVSSHLGILNVNLWTIGDASSITLMMGGILISTVYTRFVVKGEYFILWMVLAFAGFFCIAFGFLIRPYAGGISKIYSTPAWVFICMGIAILVFELLIFVVDINQNERYFKWIKAAGTSTLTCYLMPYLVYSIFDLVDLDFPNALNHGIGGILRSALFAFAIVQIVRWMEKKQLRLSV